MRLARVFNTAAGLGCLAAVGLVNPWAVGAFLARCDAVAPPWLWRTSLAVGLLLAAWGTVSLVRRHSPLLARLNLSLLSLAVAAPLAAEAALRLGIALSVPQLKRPELYAAFMGDADHWKLRHLWADPRYDYRFLFSARGQMQGEPGWREVLVKRTLGELEAPCVDSKDPLRATARTLKGRMNALYFPDGHLNERGNRLMASEIAAALQELPAATARPGSG